MWTLQGVQQIDPATLKPLDCRFWSVQLEAPWTSLGYKRWSFQHADVTIEKITQAIGPDLFATLVASMPSVMSKGTGLADALTVILVERADSLRAAVLGLMQAGLLDLCVQGLCGLQGVPGLQIAVPVSATLADGAEHQVFAGPVDVYAAAFACMMENLFPLVPGLQASRQATKVSSRVQPVATGTGATDEVPLANTVTAKAVTMPAYLHLKTWWVARGH